MTVAALGIIPEADFRLPGPNLSKDRYNTGKKANRTNIEEKSLEAAAEELKDYLSTNYSSLYEDTIISMKARLEIREHIREYVEKTSLSIKGKDNIDDIINAIEKELLDLSFITDLLSDKRIEEIRVNAPDDVRVVVEGIEYRTDCKFTSEEQALVVADKIARLAGKALRKDNPCVNARLQNGVRVAIMGPPVAQRVINITIRRQRENPFTKDDLVDNGTMTKEMFEDIVTIMDGGGKTVAAGATNTGKTGTQGAILNYTKDSDRMINISDTNENSALKIVDGKVVNSVLVWEAGVLTLKQLTVETLRHSPKRIYIQEVRAGETIELVKAGMTGHIVDTSLHTSNIDTLPDRIVTMYQDAGSNLSPEYIIKNFCQAFTIVLVMKLFNDGKRRMTGIYEITGSNGTKIEYRTLYRYVATGNEVKKVYDKYLEKEVNRTVVTGHFERVQGISPDLKEMLIISCIPMERVNELAR